MDADGTGRKNLTDTGPIGVYHVSEQAPTWSPDGTRIAFDRDGDVWTVGRDGTGELNATDTPEPPPYEGDSDWGPKPITTSSAP